MHYALQRSLNRNKLLHFKLFQTLTFNVRPKSGSKVVEFSVDTHSFTDWSRSLPPDFHPQWQCRRGVVTSAFYRGSCSTRLYLQDDYSFCYIDKTLVSALSGKFSILIYFSFLNKFRKMQYLYLFSLIYYDINIFPTAYIICTRLLRDEFVAFFTVSTFSTADIG